MFGLITQLIISLLVLWLYKKNDLSILGLRPTKERIWQFTVAFLCISIFCMLYHISVAALAHNFYTVNGNFGLRVFTESLWWTLKSVIFEELIFRGALLYIAIKMLGPKNACLISAAAFGVYHWFTYGALGNPVQMGIVFITMAMWGLMFSYAYAKTGSLYLPLGLHYGWNLVNIIIFSKGPLGMQLLVSGNQNKLQGFLSLVLFVIPIILPPTITFFIFKKKAYAIRSATNDKQN